MVSGLSANERRERIQKVIAQRGHVGCRALAEEMDVSEATVRRDLRQLADTGVVQLVYGGATAPKPDDRSLQARGELNREAKIAIARTAAQLVKDGDMLYVDAGTTCYEMAPFLAERKGLNLVVSSVRLATELGANADASVVTLGGHYRPESMDLVGPIACHSIDQLRGFVAFVGADGIDREFGVSATDIQTAFMYQHLFRNAREVVLLIDRTKFDAPSLYRIAGFEAISRIVTDRDPGETWREYLAERGVELMLAQTDRESLQHA